jgi:hypothetical protein
VLPYEPVHQREEVGKTHPRQVIWLGAEATAFAVPCEACHEDAPWPDHLPEAIVVEGTLRREADVGFTTCRRGHRISVRRIARLRVVAAR